MVLKFKTREDGNGVDPRWQHIGRLGFRANPNLHRWIILRIPNKVEKNRAAIFFYIINNDWSSFLTNSLAINALSSHSPPLIFLLIHSFRYAFPFNFAISLLLLLIIIIYCLLYHLNKNTHPKSDISFLLKIYLI